MFVCSPSEFYLKYLVTHPDGWNNTAIIEHMERKRLFTGPGYYLDRLRKETVPPKPFFPSNPKHATSKQFLLEEQIHGLWHQNEHTRMAFKLLDAPIPQETVHGMINVGADDESIAILLDKRYGMPFSLQAVDRYRKYFWNIELCSGSELRDICRKMLDGPPRASPQMLGAILPATPMSAALVQTRVGFVPRHMEEYAALDIILRVAHMRMYEALMIGGKEAAEEFRNIAWGAKFAVEMRSAVMAPQDDLRKTMRNMQLVTKPIKTPLIGEISGGNFSDGTFTEDPSKKKDGEQKEQKEKKVKK